MEQDDYDYCSDESQQDTGTFIVQSSRQQNDSPGLIDIKVQVSEPSRTDLTIPVDTGQYEE